MVEPEVAELTPPAPDRPARVEPKPAPAAPSEDAGLLSNPMVLGGVGVLLAGLVGPRVLKYLGGAKTDTAQLQIEEFGAGLDLFHLEVGRYPTTDEGLVALSVAPAGVDDWNGPYLKKKDIPADPWGNDYELEFDGNKVKVTSLGADGAEGGTGRDTDYSVE